MNTPTDDLASLLKVLRLGGFLRHHEAVSLTAERGGWSFGQYLHHLAEAEVQERRNRRIARYLKESQLPRDKTRATMTRELHTATLRQRFARLCEGHWVDKAENTLVFGLPGRGKSHLVCAIGHELVRQGRRVLFTTTFKLVQQLLVAKKELRLEKALSKLDRFVQQSRDEMEVLFTFLAERYERRSVMLTSNLVFSQWHRIFKDELVTAAAVDRLVHHCTILELTGPTLRGGDGNETEQNQEVNAES
jgi:DNA replication protein DnaC